MNNNYSLEAQSSAVVQKYRARIAQASRVLSAYVYCEL